MASISWTYCYVLIVVLSFMNSSTCTSTEHRKRPGYVKRYKDVKDMTNWLHDALPDQMPIEQKCKRYAILLTDLDHTSTPNQTTIDRLATQSDDDINAQYQKIDIKSLEARFMTTIEQYRITHLSPGFNDLISCLEQLNTPLSEEYLENEELIIIVDLYRKVLGLPSSIDINRLDMRRYHPTFRAALAHLFREEFGLQFDRVLGHQVPYRPLRRPRYSRGSSPKSSTAISSYSYDSEQHPKSRLYRAQLRYRERHIFKIRERARLKQQRLRLLDPTHERTRRKRRVRLRLREHRDIPGSWSDSRRELPPESDNDLDTIAAIDRAFTQQQSYASPQLRLQFDQMSSGNGAEQAQAASDRLMTPGASVSSSLPLPLDHAPLSIDLTLSLGEPQNITDRLPTRPPQRSLVDPLTSFPMFFQPPIDFRAASPSSPFLNFSSSSTTGAGGVQASDELSRDLIQAHSRTPINTELGSLHNDNIHGEARVEQRPFEYFVPTARTFDPGSREGQATRDVLVDCAGQFNQTESVLRAFLDEPDNSSSEPKQSSPSKDQTPKGHR